MNKIKNRIIAAALSAAGLIGLVPVSASAAAVTVSVDTIAAGESHSLVIKKDLSLWAAGDNSSGQLGLGNGKDESTGEKVMDNIVFVDASDNVSFAIDTKGTLYGWGDNRKGQILPGNSSQYIYVPTKIMDNVIDVSAGEGHTVAVTSDGKAYGWGSNSYGELGMDVNARRNAVTQIMDGVADVSAGDGFTILVTSGGAVYACGNNENGQLGMGSFRDYTTPTAVMNSGVSMAEAGCDHTLLLKTDGTVWAAGLNDCGQLGIGSDKASVSTFTSTGLSSAAAVFAGGASSGALNSSGTLYTWGDNSGGQLHNGKFDNLNKPATVTTGAVSIAFGDNHSLLLKNNGRVSAVGSGAYGELFGSVSGTSMRPELVMKNVMAYSAGTDHAAAVTDDGVLYTWGNNDSGQLGLGDNKLRNKPTRVSLNDYAVNVWCGNKCTFVETEDGSVYVFGDNSGNMLGMRTRTSKVSTPTLNSTLSGSRSIDIKPSDGFCLALMDGDVFGWGRNGSSRLADLPSTVTEPTLIANDLKNIVEIAAGTNHCFALEANGTVWAWGSNSLGQLGYESDFRIVEYPEIAKLTKKVRNTETKKMEDVDVSLRSIAAAGNHTIAIDGEGKLLVWGSNTEGQLGTSSSRVKTPESLLYNASMVAAGASACAFISNRGELSLSGSNKFGALGDGTVRNRSDFTKITAEDVDYVRVGNGFAGYVDYDRSLYAWGDNTYGQVGSGRGGVSSEPDTVITDALCQALKAADGISLDKTELTVKPNGSAKLVATVTPADAVAKQVSWSSSDTKVATVTADGTVKGVANGTATITAKTPNGLTATCKVTVTIAVTSFSVSPSSSKTLAVGKSFTFTKKVYPADAVDKTLLFSSSNTKVATVTDSGKVTAVAPGVATITVTAKSNPAKTRNVTIKVPPAKVNVTSRKSTTSGVTLKWNAVKGADGYVVYRRTSSSGKNVELAELGSGKLTYTDKSGTPGKTYYYLVKAYVEEGGVRVYSSSVTVYKIKAK